MIKYPARFEKDKIGEEDGYFLQFIDIPGAITQGYDMEELYEMGQDALSLVLEDYIEGNKEVPKPSSVQGDDIIYIEPYSEVAIPLLVKQYRKEKGLTQEDIAKELGVAYQTYQKLERGQRVNPTLKTLEKIATVFGLKLILDFQKVRK